MKVALAANVVESLVEGTKGYNAYTAMKFDVMALFICGRHLLSILLFHIHMRWTTEIHKFQHANV